VTPVLQTDRLGKRYRRRCALQDCTLAIPEGKVVGLVGPNGAGKTTLLLVLSSHLLADLDGSVTTSSSSSPPTFSSPAT
jgi:ABC-2 type transport system ATP-binding protein